MQLAERRAQAALNQQTAKRQQQNLQQKKTQKKIRQKKKNQLQQQHQKKAQKNRQRQQQQQAKPKSATGTYNGFADTSSVEIEMSDGSYQTFMVNDEELVNKLNDMDEGTKITFTYGAVEGQANMEILSIE